MFEYLPLELLWLGTYIYYPDLLCFGVFITHLVLPNTHIDSIIAFPLGFRDIINELRNGNTQYDTTIVRLEIYRLFLSMFVDTLLNEPSCFIVSYYGFSMVLYFLPLQRFYLDSWCITASVVSIYTFMYNPIVLIPGSVIMYLNWKIHVLRVFPD